MGVFGMAGCTPCIASHSRSINGIYRAEVTKGCTLLNSITIDRVSFLPTRQAAFSGSHTFLAGLVTTSLRRIC
jgi:hypothetical protein